MKKNIKKRNKKQSIVHCVCDLVKETDECGVINNGGEAREHRCIKLQGIPRTDDKEILRAQIN